MTVSLWPFFSGPSFAAEVSRQLPTAVSVASRDPAVVEQVQADSGHRKLAYACVRCDRRRVRRRTEERGCGAGMAEGLALGHSAAGLITRGLAEITRLACARGAAPRTLAGLSGLGDLVLTCAGSLSRSTSGLSLRVVGRSTTCIRHEDGGRGSKDH